MNLINYCFRIVFNHYDWPFDLDYKKRRVLSAPSKARSLYKDYLKQIGDEETKYLSFEEIFLNQIEVLKIIFKNYLI